MHVLTDAGAQTARRPLQAQGKQSPGGFSPTGSRPAGRALAPWYSLRRQYPYERDPESYLARLPDMRNPVRRHCWEPGSGPGQTLTLPEPGSWTSSFLGCRTAPMLSKPWRGSICYGLTELGRGTAVVSSLLTSVCDTFKHWKSSHSKPATHRVVKPSA